jgi:hypothetical protein
VSWTHARGTSNGITVRIVALDGSRERRQVLLKMMLWVLKALRVIDNNLSDILEQIDLAQNDMTLGIEKTIPRTEFDNEITADVSVFIIQSSLLITHGPPT